MPATPHTNSNFLKIDEVAQTLKVKPITIYKWINEGKIKAHRLAGSSLRISQRDLSSFINVARQG